MTSTVVAVDGAASRSALSGHVTGHGVSGALFNQLQGLGEFDADACMNCGVCTATCPLETGMLPRRLFRYAVLGMADRVRSEQEAVFSCLLCRACESACPGGVHITGNVLVLRNWLLRDWGES
jgi:heterodisulfide reductase subunit C